MKDWKLRSSQSIQFPRWKFSSLAKKRVLGNNWQFINFAGGDRDCPQCQDSAV